MESLGVLRMFASSFLFPQQLFRWLVGIQFHHHGPAVKARDKEFAILHARRRYRHAGLHRQFFGPVQFSRLRIEAIDGFGMPNDELTLAAGLDNNRRAIAWLLGRKSVP